MIISSLKNLKIFLKKIVLGSTWWPKYAVYGHISTRHKGGDLGRSKVVMLIEEIVLYRIELGWAGATHNFSIAIHQLKQGNTS